MAGSSRGQLIYHVSSTALGGPLEKLLKSPRRGLSSLQRVSRGGISPLRYKWPKETTSFYPHNSIRSLDQIEQGVDRNPKPCPGLTNWRALRQHGLLVLPLSVEEVGSEIVDLLRFIGVSR